MTKLKINIHTSTETIDEGDPKDWIPMSQSFGAQLVKLGYKPTGEIGVPSSRKKNKMTDMFKKDAAGILYLHKTVRIKFYKEEVDWVAQHLFQPRIVNDSIRKKAVNRMMWVILNSNTKIDYQYATWIVDCRDDKTRKLMLSDPDRDRVAYKGAPITIWNFARLEKDSFKTYNGMRFYLER